MTNAGGDCLSDRGRLRHDGAVILEPNHGRYDSRLVRRHYEGSSVEIGPDRVRWVPPIHRAYDRGGFSVEIGRGPGQACAVTRVRTAFPSRSSDGLIDRYVVTDSGGTVLGSFPSGEGITDSALPQHQAGWYPVTTVQAAVEEAGLTWSDRDYIGDAPALATAFPGVVPHLRALHRLAWVQAGVYVLGGLTFLGMSVGWLVGASRFEGMQIIALAMSFLLGLTLTALGALASPTVLRWMRRRHLARNTTPS